MHLQCQLSRSLTTYSLAETWVAVASQAGNLVLWRRRPTDAEKCISHIIHGILRTTAVIPVNVELVPRGISFFLHVQEEDNFKVGQASVVSTTCEIELRKPSSYKAARMIKAQGQAL
eukprot:1777370-Amphidinium_carterae.1